MSIHLTNKDKPKAQKCRHFCFSFDLHNYCPTCRKAGKGDDPCVTFEMSCDICASFTDDQMRKIQHRKHYLKKQKAETSTKDDKLDLLGEGDGDSFTGSNADLESAADNLFTSPPPKKQSHSRSRHEIEPRSASDQSNEESDEPRIPSTKPKKHSGKSKHKSRSRYVSSSSEEDQSPVARHRSSKPSGAQPSGAVSDQDLPQHDPDSTLIIGK